MLFVSVFVCYAFNLFLWHWYFPLLYEFFRGLFRKPYFFLSLLRSLYSFCQYRFLSGSFIAFTLPIIFWRLLTAGLEFCFSISGFIYFLYLCLFNLLSVSFMNIWILAHNCYCFWSGSSLEYIYIFLFHLTLSMVIIYPFFPLIFASQILVFTCLFISL